MKNALLMASAKFLVGVGLLVLVNWEVACYIVGVMYIVDSQMRFIRLQKVQETENGLKHLQHLAEELTKKDVGVSADVRLDPTNGGGHRVYRL